MLRPWININIQQAPTPLWAGRNRAILLDFATSWEIDSSWEDHTDTCKLVLPKNIILQADPATDQTKSDLFRETGTYNVILGGSGVGLSADGENTDTMGNAITVPPLVMRGDIVSVSDGYFFFDKSRNQKQVGQVVFQGYVSKVHAKTPIEIECEDNFYLLKKTPVGIAKWTGNLIDLMTYCIGQVNALFHDQNPAYPQLTVSTIVDKITANFSLGYLDIGNSSITVALLLSRLKQQYKLESTFIHEPTDTANPNSRGALQFGFPIYNEVTANNSNCFEFYNNLFGNELEYKNKDDIELSATVSCVELTSTGTTRDGQAKTRKTREAVLIYWDNKTQDFTYVVKKTGEPLPVNENGERHDFKYMLAPGKTASDTDLFTWGKQQLMKYYYTGYRGTFDTFGYPYVQWNDNVNLIDPVMADHNGVYKVKRVTRKGHVDNGIRQTVEVDFKQQVTFPATTGELYML